MMGLGFLPGGHSLDYVASGAPDKNLAREDRIMPSIVGLLEGLAGYISV